mmetsp:Transcript_17829/g.12783  ORF Transcript_17829/g.12783 Transcript_17829/m.12783 type:complete len:115 (+) Transcript_17829:1012-1356(+)
MPQPLRAHSVVSLPDGIYVLGGFNGVSYVNNVDRFEPSSGSWTKMRPMSQSRGTFSALVAPSCSHIYVVGGFDGLPVEHVERYEVVRNQWEYLAPLKQKRFMHAACLSNIDKKI